MATTFYIEQFGCRATQADAAAIERQLLDRGCTPVREPASAQFVVVNTCTVTAAADTQARDAIRKIHTANPQAKIIATGCYAQRAPEDLANLPGVSWVVGNSHKPKISSLIATPAAPRDFVPAATLLSSSPPIRPSAVVAQHAAPERSETSSASASSVGAGLGPPSMHLGNILHGNIFDHTEFLSAPVQGGESDHTRPTLKIQDGCNLRCTYCVIPFVRGKSRSLPPDDVIAEIRRLSESNSREIVLSGINLGTYGRDLTPRADFLTLLRRIFDETEIERLRLSSIEPQDVTQDLIEVFAENNRLADHFHMPLQSGSDNILAAMHRWYRAEHYARRVELIRDRLPHAAIGADVIAGFPGETEADHAATLAFIERLPFTYLHVFSYSQRPGTKAAALSNQVPTHVIKRRARELRALSERKSVAFRQSQLGRTLSVLTLCAKPDIMNLESARSAPQFTPAVSSNYARVQLPGVLAANEFRQVQITHTEGAHLFAAGVPR
jgi:threonylcarbamoyladenosine tRNA methylthiotransferase MtaB